MRSARRDEPGALLGVDDSPLVPLLEARNSNRHATHALDLRRFHDAIAEAEQLLAANALLRQQRSDHFPFPNAGSLSLGALIPEGKNESTSSSRASCATWE